MKIAYLMPGTKLPSKAAHTVHIMKMCEALSDIGHEIYLIGPSLEKDEDQNIYDFYSVNENFKIIEGTTPPVRLIGTLINSFLSVNIAVKMDTDLLYTRNETLAYMATLSGLKTVYESHAPVFSLDWGRVRNRIFKKLLRKKEFISLVVISRRLKQFYENNHNIDSKSIILARDSSHKIDTSIKSVEYQNNESLQVGYVGNLYKGRGKNIIKKLAKKCDFAHFHIIGGNEDAIKTWKKELDYNNVKFHGFIPQSKLDKFRLGFDVLLAPYRKNLNTFGGKNTVQWMSPLKIFEYMATGKPIIASDLPAIREILTHERDALLCAPDKPDEWIESLKRLKNSRLRGRLGKRARDKFEKNYTWEKRAKKIIKKISKKID